MLWCTLLRRYRVGIRGSLMALNNPSRYERLNWGTDLRLLVFENDVLLDFITNVSLLNQQFLKLYRRFIPHCPQVNIPVCRT